MAKVVLIGLEDSAATQIGHALADGPHQIERRSRNAGIEEVLEADIVFADGAQKSCLSLLKRVRRIHPSLPFVVVTKNPQAAEWLDALEAGATDYCSAPFDSRQIGWVMQSALPQPRIMAA